MRKELQLIPSGDALVGKIRDLSSGWRPPEEFSRLQENFPELGVLLDLGHLQIDSRRLVFRIEDFIYCMKDSVSGIHLHENDGLSDQLSRSFK